MHRPVAQVEVLSELPDHGARILSRIDPDLLDVAPVHFDFQRAQRSLSPALLASLALSLFDLLSWVGLLMVRSILLPIGLTLVLSRGRAKCIVD